MLEVLRQIVIGGPGKTIDIVHFEYGAVGV